MSATKLVKVMMGALRRQQFCAVIEVPADLADYELLEFLDSFLDGSEYTDDPHYWDRGDEYVTVPDDDEKATLRAVVTAGPSLTGLDYIGPEIVPEEHPLKAQLDLCERGGNLFSLDEGDFNAWLPVAGGYLEISWRQGNYPCLNTAFVTLSSEELARHINEKLPGAYAQKCNIEGVNIGVDSRVRDSVNGD